MAEMETEVSFEMDEDLQSTESRIKELRKKTDKTPEEEKEFKDLKSHHRSRLTEQLQEKDDARVREAERAARAEQALEDANRRLKELNESRDNRGRVDSASDEETIIINGKKFYTDEALNARVQAGKMTQAEAWKQQKSAIKEEAIAEIKGSAPRDEAEKVRRETMDEVTREYPEFVNDKHPKHNPKDPLYVEANRLWTNGYCYNPRGMKLAIEDAKKNLGIGLKRPDLSEDLSVSRNNTSSDSSSVKSKTIELTEIERDNAIRYWVGGQVSNPKTGRPYTQAEALQKAMDAKRKRQEQYKK